MPLSEETIAFIERVLHDLENSAFDGHVFDMCDDIAENREAQGDGYKNSRNFRKV